MDLVGRVLRALEERSVHPGEFERCACALLQVVYPGLSAVEGGHDFGRDADIYFALSESDPDSRGRLLATTGDPVDNLRRGLRRMREENVRVDLVVMACLLPVNATQRATLGRQCTDQGLPEPHIYARDWFVARLVEEPEWRLRLLDVGGELEALLARPLEMLEHDTPDPPALVGREAELADLRSAIDTARDVVLVGVPGVGKTRLATELDRLVGFLQYAEHGRVVDALVHMKPMAVVVDDAHTRLEDLRVLRQIRAQEKLAFSIIASTWPDRAEVVLTDLPGADTATVDLLERSEMDALVCSVGITSHRARMLILEQAEGRPGWALALCEVLVAGEDHEVVTGAALLAHAERFLRRTTGSQTALDAMACVAAMGSASTEIVYQIASLVGVPPAELRDTLNRLARNGLLEQTNRGWAVQPALRPALIARWFFTEPTERPWSTLVTAFPAEKPVLISAAISAARLGSAKARQTIEEWAQSIPEPAGWDVVTCGLLAEYATVDEPAARFAVTQARAALTADLPLQQIAGITYDPITPILKRLIAQAARQWLLPEAVSTLLDLAIADPRPRPQNPDHPLRVLADLAHLVDPDFGTGFPIRERLLEYTLAWLADNPSPDRWTIAAELIAAIFSPDVSGQWATPGAPNTITIARGYESAANLQRLLGLWPRVAQTVITARQSSSPVCPPEAIALLVDLVGEWRSLSAGVGFLDQQVTDDQQQAGRVGAQQILESLRPVIAPVPGLAVRAQRLQDRSQIVEPAADPPAPFDLDADLLALLGPHHQFDDDIEAELRERDRRIDDLAQRLAALDPVDGTTRFAELDQQARLAGHNTGGYAEWVAMRMQPHLVDPVAWYRAARDQQVPALLRATMRQILDDAPTVLPREEFTTHLRNPAFRPTIVAAVLARTVLDELSRQVIEDLNKSDAGMLCRLISSAAPTEVVHDLLRHPVPAVAGAAAVSLAVGYVSGPTLPEGWRSDWATAMVNLRADELDRESQQRVEPLLGQLATHDPDLLERWFTQRLEDMSSRSLLSVVEPRGCQHHLAALPQTHRERLARRYAQLLGTGMPRVGQGLLTYLIGADRDLAERLLTEQVITTNHLLDAISGQRNEILEQLGPLLLENEVDPGHIAAYASVPPESGFGPQSTMHEQMCLYFSSLGERVPALESVAQAGLIQQTAQRQQADVYERQERVRGR